MKSVRHVVVWHRKPAEVKDEWLEVQSNPSAIARRYLAGMAREGD